MGTSNLVRRLRAFARRYRNRTTVCECRYGFLVLEPEYTWQSDVRETVLAVARAVVAALAPGRGRAEGGVGVGEGKGPVETRHGETAPGGVPGALVAAPQLRARFEAAGGKPTYVRQMFDRIARVYDLMNRLMTAGLDRHWRDFAARRLGLTSGELALDLGAGTGDLAIAVARRSPPDAHVIGVDFAPEMLARGREKLARLGLSERIELRVGDGEHLDFADGTFDACCSAFVVRNLADLGGGFAEMLRVVKPGGRVVCLEISHPRSPVFGALFHLYFDRLVPLLGRVVGRAFDAYSYLPSSVSVFPDAPGLASVMESAGWEDVHYHRLTGGIVAVHVGTKPGASPA